MFSVLASCPEALPQCTTGHLAITGRIENYAGQTVQVEVTVFLKKGKTVTTSAINGPSFSIDAAFSTVSSYSLLWGHRCNNSPVSVILKIASGKAKLAEENLSIKDDFRIDAPLRYTLRKDLILHLRDAATNTHGNAEGS